MNKKKIINDPLYGFITIPNNLIYDLINHPYFQRLRRIKQLGLTDFVYPGALHTRFHHAIGAMHLMSETLTNLRNKGIEISDEELNGALVAILLHDIGHTPFSHALENELISDLSHEQISGIIMKKLNEDFGGLDLAIKIFNDQYDRRFFHQLVSSQLDVDRLDYLNRDSFFTGVVEGRISANRIIKLLSVVDDELVVEEKGIYSIENFLSARRLMYWQVYIHKTTLGVEQLLVQIVRRSKEVSEKLDLGNSSIKYFLKESITSENLLSDPDLFEAFCSLDDYDILGMVKLCLRHPDRLLSTLSRMLLNRDLYSVELSEKKITQRRIDILYSQLSEKTDFSVDELKYFILQGVKTNAAYIGGGQKINIITKNAQIEDIANATDLPNIKAMRKIVKKYYLCWPKNVSL